MNKTFFKQLSKRRSIYALGKDVHVNDFEVETLLMEALNIAPSAFNSQSARIILLLGEQHRLLWQHTFEILKRIITPQKQGATKKRIEGFLHAYGTILFFEDENVINVLKKEYPTYQDRFATWAEHGNAMLQYIVWSMLACENLGASLQHYNPLIDGFVHQQWNVDSSWRLIAQMPFGTKLEKALNKKIIAPEKRMRIFA